MRAKSATQSTGTKKYSDDDRISTQTIWPDVVFSAARIAAAMAA
jgi:hypothetical protein